MFEEQQASFPNFTFLPLPNPNPLLSYSFDVPQPIIHPPGTDPYSLSEYGNVRLEPLPALDVDPSAASWSEIITKTTDLTASEHAGRTLSETTLVSTTSHSPGNSGVVTQHLVNVVISITIQSENTRSIQCDVCNITCNSEDVLKRHKHGKKHLKNLQKPALSSAFAQETLPPAANATLGGELEKKQHNLLQKGASVNSLPFCNISDVGCNNQDISTVHLEGKKHAAKVTSGLLCWDGLPNPTSVSTSPVQPSNCGTQKAQEKLNFGQPLWCEVCKVSCNKDKVLSRHILGKKHLKNLKILGKMLTVPSAPIASMTTIPITEPVENPKPTEGEIVISEEGKPACCEICKVNCSSSVLSRHISGKQHLKNLQKSEKIPGLPPTPIASVATPPIAGPVENPKSTEGIIVNSKAGKPAGCELCKTGCSCNVLGRNILGRKHLKNLTKSEKMLGLPSTPIASVATPPSTEPVENLKSTEDEIVNSEKGKPAWCEVGKASCSSNVLSRHALQKSEKMPGLRSIPIASAATPPSSEPVENPKSTEDEIVNSEEGKPAWCEVCNASCSSNVLSRHVSGKIHLKNLQKSEKIPGLSSTSIASVTTPPTGPVENPKPTKGEVVNSNEGKSAWCELCGIGCGTYDVLNKHISGKKHQKAMKKSEKLIESEKIPGLFSIPIASVTTPPTGPVENPKPTKGEVVNSKEGKSAWCELCGIGCSTYDVLNKHISGKKHQKAMKKSEKLIGPSPASAAEPSVTGPLQDSVNEEANVVMLESCKRKAKSSVAGHEDLDTKRQKMLKEGAASGSLLTCTLCNVVCNSPMIFTSHLAGQEHVAMALKQVTAGSNGQQV